MNASDSVDPNASPGTPDAPADGEAAPKPRRRRVTKKSAEAEAPAVDVASPPVVDTPAAGDAEAPVPKRARRRRATGPVAEAPPAEPAVVPAEAPPPPVALHAEPHPPAVEAAANDSGAEPPTDAVASEGGADAMAPREGGKRRRNRRRRRDRGERGPRAADAQGKPDADSDAEADDGEVDGEAAVPAPAIEPLPPTDPNELFAEVLSGAFDQEAPPDQGAAAPAEPPRRVLAPEPDAPKLHKVLAQAGIGSRRDMEQWVLEGRVTVNGEPAHTGQRISFGDRIAVNGKPVKVRIAPPPPRVLAYHKPAGEVVTHDDPQQRPTVFRRLPRLPHGKWQSVGRLDINTEGLLLFTNSGELANQLMHPRFGVEREYAVRCLGLLDEEQRERLLEGVEIDGQRAGFKSIADGGGEGANHWYRVVITEGRHREVRRLFEAVDHVVSRLIRIRYGCVVLPRGLKRGVWVDLPEPDVRALRRLTGTERPREGAEAGPGSRGNKRGRRGGRSRERLREGMPDRPPRQDLGEAPEHAGDSDGPMHIPNPLQQTYDKRFIQQARAQRRELTEDDPIPNPLQQTYDRRALQREHQPVRDVPEDGPIPNPLQQTYDRRFVQKGGGGGRGGQGQRGRGGPGGAPGGAGGQRQPDPMQTSMGYIGADALRGKRGKGGGRGGKGGGRKGGGGGPPRGPQGGRGR